LKESALEPSPRAALYVRVSTREQTTKNQELELRRWADRLGFEVVCVYSETASGARSDRVALADERGLVGQYDVCSRSVSRRTGPAPRPAGAMAKTSTGGAMFFKVRGPSTWNSALSARLTWSNT
jgi:hypothetical protein